jgi:hypothetical protein
MRGILHGDRVSTTHPLPPTSVPMKHRIGLVSSKGFGRSTTAYVEVADVAELAAELKKNNAKRAILYWRDRFGDGQTEGKEFAVDTLSETHFQWLCAVQKDGMRGLFYDRAV